MIDEKKIEEAAKNFCESLEDERKAIQQAELDKGAKTAYTFIRPEVAFEAGINWFKENLWHDASEVPDRVEEILLEQEFNGKKQHQAYMFYSASFFREHCRECGVTRWLYMEDLMKGGK